MFQIANEISSLTVKGGSNTEAICHSEYVTLRSRLIAYKLSKYINSLYKVLKSVISKRFGSWHQDVYVKCKPEVSKVIQLEHQQG